MKAENINYMNPEMIISKLAEMTNKKQIEFI